MIVMVGEDNVKWNSKNVGTFIRVVRMQAGYEKAMQPGRGCCEIQDE